ncbi:PREDICTED: BEL1-like homeodomain protein 3 [Camelina sativa]|uniref:BEL1-like homeodomain protein 3 n=1 Tax=Camelina sativa TaxID=90675 RepID=A0ABM0TMJ8_CAMSA|nr:PREDICTED: BEL1-like homeodomain protein 3 [Camelina sativa]
MAVYYPNSVGMQSMYHESIYLNEQQQQQQQQATSSSAASFSEIVSGDVRHNNEMVFIPPTTSDVAVNGNVTVSSNDLSFHGGGLSLSLGNQIQSAVSVSPFQYHYQNLSNQLNYNNASTMSPDENGKSLSGHHHHHHHHQQQQHHSDQMIPSSGYNNNNNGVGFYNNYRYETSGFVSSVLRSRYLKPTQQLLDEVVSVRKELKLGNKKMKNNDKGQDFQNGSSDNNITEDEKPQQSQELSPSERQELQNKKSKLLTMVDEVDKRYNQYHHQMEALASSFEMVTGLGAAKPYTSVALNRISRHFRCLRDAIKEQIQVIRGKLGERETSDEQGERIPRLRYLDQRLRQQRALHQQLGMVRPAWRPQRGLPENSVSILRAWLFEHFLHPYPKESEKIMLSKQTGLSKNQVANWFINARVRLWKPMIEEMYKEEFGDSELETNSNQDNNKTQETSQLKHEESSSQQHNQGNINNNNIAYTSHGEENLVFADPKPDRATTGEYDSLMNYHGFGIDDYNRYVGLGNQQDARFSNPHQLHDFVV